MGLLESASDWMNGLGIPPILGGVVAGAVATFALLSRRKAGSTAPEPPPPVVEPSAAGGFSVTVHGNTLQLPGQVQQLVQNKRLIEAIKEVRAATGLGLKDAKDVVDQIARSLR